MCSVCGRALIATGKNHYGRLKIGQSIGLVACSLMLVVAAFGARSGTETAFTGDTFNSSRMNLIAPAEVAGAVPHHTSGLYAAAARYRSADRRTVEPHTHRR